MIGRALRRLSRVTGITSAVVLAAVLTVFVPGCGEYVSTGVTGMGDLENYVGTGVREVVYEEVIASGGSLSEAVICEKAGANVVCGGKTTDGREITAEATGGSTSDLEAVHLVVSIGGQGVYDGSLTSLLEEHATAPEGGS